MLWFYFRSVSWSCRRSRGGRRRMTSWDRSLLNTLMPSTSGYRRPGKGRAHSLVALHIWCMQHVITFLLPGWSTILSSVHALLCVAVYLCVLGNGIILTVTSVPFLCLCVCVSAPLFTCGCWMLMMSLLDDITICLSLFFFPLSRCLSWCLGSFF